MSLFYYNKRLYVIPGLFKKLMPNTYQKSYQAILIIQVCIGSNFLTLNERKKLGRVYALVRIDYCDNMLVFFCARILNEHYLICCLTSCLFCMTYFFVITSGRIHYTWLPPFSYFIKG